MARRRPSQLFLAGDIRANENSLLTSLHTVFAREHNRLVDVIAAQQPALNAEQQYQLARKIVGAEMQMITYQEFLPALAGQRPAVPKAEAVRLHHGRRRRDHQRVRPCHLSLRAQHGFARAAAGRGRRHRTARLCRCGTRFSTRRF